MLSAGKIGISAFLMIALGTASLSASESTQWRGNDRSGVYPEKNLLKKWPDGGPSMLWSQKGIGSGYASMCVTKDRVFVTGNGKGEKKKSEFLTALDKSGKILWQTEYGSVTDKSYSETRTTPTLVNGNLYVTSGMGELASISAADGKLNWKVNAAEETQGRPGSWGFAESPLVFDGKVLYTASGSKASMIALNCNDGSVAWKSEALPGNDAYVSPIMIERGGKKQIVGMTGKFVIGVNPADGKIVWKFEFTSSSLKSGKVVGINCVTPVYKDGYVFVTTGYDQGGVMLKLSDDLSSAESVWQTADLDTHHGGVVLLDGVLYGSNWLDNSKGNWAAVDWKTGKTYYNEKWDGKGKGSTVSADGMLYCYDESRGTVGLVNPDKSKFDVVSEFQIKQGGGPHWCHPVISDGVLYIRHGDVIMAFDVKAGK